MIPIYKPYLTKENLKYVHDAIDSTWISSQGYYLDASKEKLKEILNVKWVVLTNNGTTATHLIAKSIQFKDNRIKNIICPNNVYVAAWNSFLYDGNFNLKPIDSNIDTWNMDLNKINNLTEEDAILVVHNLGNIINVPKLKEKFSNTVIVEDNCEGFLGEYSNKYSGTESLSSSISFFGNKTLTSGEGGCFITNDDDVFEYINNIRNQGQSSEKFIHNYLGYNYRMTNLQAAILFGQLSSMDEILDRKRHIFDRYKKNLSDVTEISFQKIENDTCPSNWMFSVRFNNFTTDLKQKLQLFLYDKKIETRTMFYSINQHEHLKKFSLDNTISDLLNSQIILLPSFPELTNSQVDYISNSIKNFIKNNKK
jgi:perosamine synthetase